MSKILVLPDIHGRTFWKKPCESIDEYDRVIFLGDYLDPYDFEKISRDDAKHNFIEILKLKKEHPDKVVLLLGNHDGPYFSQKYKRLSHYHSRTAPSYMWDELHALYDNTDNTFTLAHVEGGVLFTHAGVVDHWLIDAFYEKYHNLKTAEDVRDIINRILKDENFSALFMVGSFRGGMDRCGSCIWADVHEIFLRCDSEDSPLMSGIKQVFGHTMQAFYAPDGSGNILFGEPIETANFKMLDTADAYILDTDTFKIQKICED